MLSSRKTRFSRCWSVLLLAVWLWGGPTAVGAQGPELDPRIKVPATLADYPEANALLLLDDIAFQVRPDRSHVFEEHDAVRVLTPDGVEENSSVDRIFDERQTRIEVLMARTVKADGRVVPAAAPEIAPLAPDSKIYGALRRFSLRFAELEVGDTVEFHLRTHHAPKPGGHFWATTYVENPMPILDSSFTVTIPEGVFFRAAAPGVTSGAPQEETLSIDGVEHRRLRWQVRDQKAFEFRALAPNTLSLLARIEISSFRDWAEVAEYIGQRWREHSTISEGLALRIAGWMPASSDPATRARAVLRELSAKRKVASFLSEEPHFHRPSSVYEEELISMADSSLLLSVALSSAGIPNVPVVSLGVASSSLDDELPHPEKVERIILQLPISGGEPLWVDPEAPGFLLNAPPLGSSGTAAFSWDARFAGRPGVVQDLEAAPAVVNREELAVEGRVEASGRAELTLQYDRYGGAALSARQAARDIKEGARGVRERALDSFFSSAAMAYGERSRLLSRFFESDPEVQDPFSLAFTVAVPGFGRVENGELMVPLPRFLASSIRAVARESSRSIPLRFEQPFQQDVRIHLIFPEGSQVVEAPARIEKSTPEVDFVATGRAQGNEVWYVGRLTVRDAWVEGEEMARTLEVLAAALASENTPIKAKMAAEPPVGGAQSEGDEG